MSIDQEKPDEAISAETEIGSEIVNEEQPHTEVAEHEYTIEELKKELEEAKLKNHETWDKAVRIQAEMENLKRRTQKDLEDAHKFTLTNSSQTNYYQYYYNGFGYSESTSGGKDTLDPIVFDATTGSITFQIPTLSILSDSTTTGTYSSLTGIQGNTTFASNIYSGFYLLSNNYDGLLKTLGFILPGIIL